MMEFLRKYVLFTEDDAQNIRNIMPFFGKDPRVTGMFLLLGMFVVMMFRSLVGK